MDITDIQKSRIERGFTKCTGLYEFTWDEVESYCLHRKSKALLWRNQWSSVLWSCPVSQAQVAGMLLQSCRGWEHPFSEYPLCRCLFPAVAFRREWSLPASSRNSSASKQRSWCWLWWSCAFCLKWWARSLLLPKCWTASSCISIPCIRRWVCFGLYVSSDRWSARSSLLRECWRASSYVWIFCIDSEPFVPCTDQKRDEHHHNSVGHIYHVQESFLVRVLYVSTVQAYRHSRRLAFWRVYVPFLVAIWISIITAAQVLDLFLVLLNHSHTKVATTHGPVCVNALEGNAL